jgi:hypothetical protein
VLKTTSKDEPKKCKKDAKKKNLLATDSRNQVESSPNVDENIAYSSVQKEVNFSSLHQKEEKDMKKLFHITIHIKSTKVDALLDFGS